MPRLLSPSWILKHLFAVVIVVPLIMLGFWQLDRREQRRAQNAERQAIVAQNPTTLTGNEAAPVDFAGRKVRLVGTFVPEESVVLRNQRDDIGANGVHLLTPLRLRGSDQAVIIDRGWLPAEVARNLDLSTYAITTEVTLEGIARMGQVRPDALLAAYDLPLPGETRISAWIRVDLAKLQNQVSVPLLPIYVEAFPDPLALPDDLPRPRNPNLMDEGPHFGYAIQWFTFAGIICVGYTLLIGQELRRKG